MKTKEDAFGIEKVEKTKELIKEKKSELVQMDENSVVSNEEIRENFVVAQGTLNEGLEVALETLKTAQKAYQSAPLASDKILRGIADIIKSMNESTKTIADLHNIVDKPRTKTTVEKSESSGNKPQVFITSPDQLSEIFKNLEKTKIIDVEPKPE